MPRRPDLARRAELAAAAFEVIRDARRADQHAGARGRARGEAADAVLLLSGSRRGVRVGARPDLPAARRARGRADPPARTPARPAAQRGRCHARVSSRTPAADRRPVPAVGDRRDATSRPCSIASAGSWSPRATRWSPICAGASRAARCATAIRSGSSTSCSRCVDGVLVHHVLGIARADDVIEELAARVIESAPRRSRSPFDRQERKRT